MGSQSVDVNNLDHLHKCKLIINNNPEGVDMLVDRFPFHELQNIPELNFGVISLIGNVITLFINHAKPTTRILDVIKFYQRIIRFQIDTKENNFQLLKKCLSEFLLCFKWAILFKKKYVCNDLNQLLFDIVTYSQVPSEIIEIAIEIFINILLALDVEQCNENFRICALGIYKSASNVVIKLRLSHQLIFSTDTLSFPDIKQVYEDVIHYTADLQKITNFELLSNSLKCVLAICDYCDDETILQSLAISLASNDFPKVLTGRYTDETSIKQVKDIYHWEISYIFKDTPWICKTASLSQIINCLSSSYSVVNNDHEDFKLILHYMQLVYTGVEYEDRTSLIDTLKKYEKNIPEGNPALLKSIYLLCAAYADITLDFPEFYSIILSLQVQNKTQDYITYHISQLLWVLIFGNRQLKLTVLALYLKNYKTESHIIRCLERTENQWCLLDVFKLNDDKPLRLKALEMLKKCTSPQRRRYLLLYFFTKPDLPFEILELFMEAKLMIPLDLLRLDNLDQEVKSYAILAIRRFVRLLCDSSSTISDNLNVMIIEYLHRLCFVRNDEIAIKFLVSAELFKNLILLTQRDSIDLMSGSINLLTVILQAQFKQRLIMQEEIELRVFNMQRNDLIVGKTVRLLKIIYRMNLSNNINIKLPYLEWYHSMLDVLTSKQGCDILYFLVYFMKHEKECFWSMLNIMYIKMYCKQRMVNDMFIRYLCMWCSYAIREDRCYIPVKHIALYIDYLDQIRYSNVRRLRKLQLIIARKKEKDLRFSC